MLLKPAALFMAAIACLLAGLALPRFVPIPPTAQGLLAGLGAGLLFAAFLRWRLPDQCDTATPALRRRYLRDFVPAMAGYVVLLSLSLWLLKRVEEPALRALVALLPVPPIALVLRAMVRYIRDADELQRQIELQAVSLATALVSLLYMAGGFLQLAKVIDVRAGVAMIWVLPLVCLVYGLAKIAVGRRFR